MYLIVACKIENINQEWNQLFENHKKSNQREMSKIPQCAQNKFSVGTLQGSRFLLCFQNFKFEPSIWLINFLMHFQWHLESRGERIKAFFLAEIREKKGFLGPRGGPQPRGQEVLPNFVKGGWCCRTILVLSIMV